MLIQHTLLASLALAPLVQAQCDEERFTPAAPVANEAFGHGMAYDSGWLAVWGGDGGPQRVRVYLEHAGGWHPWNEVTTLASSQDVDGTRVDLDGHTLVVGDPYADEGAVYLYLHTGGLWFNTQILKAPGAQAGDLFGWSVSLSGDDLVVGAWERGGTGSILHYHRNGGHWSFQQEILPPEENVQAFGRCLAVSGDRLVTSLWDGVSARMLFYEFSGGAWSLTEDLHTGLFGLGQEARIDGTHAAVSMNQGAKVLLFEQVAGAWSHVQTLAHVDSLTDGDLGRGLDLVDDTLLLGSPGSGPDPTSPGPGGALVYQWNGAQWTETHRLFPSTAVGGDRVGDSVVLTPDRFVLGAPHTEVAGAPLAGLVHSLHRGAPNHVRFCESREGSHGKAAQISLHGSQNDLPDSLGLRIQRAGAHNPVHFLIGQASGPAPFGDGALCIDGRLGLGTAVTKAHGAAKISFDLAAWPQIQPGTTWTFQAIYRDGGTGAMQTSDAIAVTFCP